MPELPVLAYVEHCLPGSDSGERWRRAREHDLALEVANREGLDIERLRRSGIPVCTVQAWEMHGLHPLHPDPGVWRAAEAHVRRTIEIAARLGAPRVLTVCGYGERTVDLPLERCRDFFARLVPFARERGVRILVEPLGRRRAAAMNTPDSIDRLLDDLDAADAVGIAIDTGHLLDDGLDPLAVLAGRRRPVDELQLRGAGSMPPSPKMPVETWLDALPEPPAVVSVEHRDPVPAADLELLLRALRIAVDSDRRYPE